MSSKDVAPVFAALKAVTLTGDNALESWKRYKQKVQWITDGLLNKLTNKKKVSILMAKIEDEEIDLYDIVPTC